MIGNKDWTEIIVCVHGITPEKFANQHKEMFVEFCDKVAKALPKAKKGHKPQWDFDKSGICVEWGWEGSPGEDKHLSRAERMLVSTINKNYLYPKGGWGPKLPSWKSPLLALVSCILSILPCVKNKIRKGTNDLFMYGVSDIYYYSSVEGEETVRGSVFEQIFEELNNLFDFKQLISQQDKGLSITFIGHSAGTVILHDLLYHIFRQNDPSIQQVWGCQKRDKLLSFSNQIRQLARQKQIRMRRFYTLGSPITPLILRSNHLVREFQDKVAFLKPEDIGISSDPDLPGPRWLNFWNQCDIISYPVALLYGGDFIEDECIDFSPMISPPEVHGAYLRSKKVAKIIAGNY